MCPVNGCKTIILGGTRDDWEVHFKTECNSLGVIIEPHPWETTAVWNTGSDRDA